MENPSATPTMPAISAWDAARAGASALRSGHGAGAQFLNYVEQVKGPTTKNTCGQAHLSPFASNMVKSFINNGWCVQSWLAGGRAAKELPIHLYDLGTRQPVKILSEVMIRNPRV